MKILHLFLVGLCFILFTSFATTDLALPGPQDDESVHACLAIDLMRPPHPFSEAYTLHWGLQPFPFGPDRHCGALKAYLLWPLFALFGPSVELMRLFTVCLGLLTLLFFYLYGREILGAWPAFLTLLLLSLDSSFIFYSKLDVGPVIEQLLWMMVAFWSFEKWRRGHQLFYLVVDLLSVVLGVYSHIAFIWVVLAFLAGSLLFFPGEVTRLFRKPAVYVAVPLTLCTLVIFLYWLIGDKRFLLKKPPGFWGAILLFERLSTKGGMLPDLFLGNYTKVLFIPGIKGRPITDIFLVGSFSYLLTRYQRQSKEIRFMMFLSGVIFLEFLLTPGGFLGLSHRMMPFYLFLIFFAGVAVTQSVKCLRHIKSQPKALTVASFGVILLAALSVWGQVSLKQEVDQKIRQTGGKKNWSDTIYILADFIERGNWEEVICLDWYLRRPLFLITEGKIPLTYPFWSLNAQGKAKRRPLLPLIEKASSRTLFLLHPERMWSVGFGVQEFLEGVGVLGKKAQLEHLFYDREGDLIYVAYTVQIKKP